MVVEVVALQPGEINVGPGDDRAKLLIRHDETGQGNRLPLDTASKKTEHGLRSVRSGVDELRAQTPPGQGVESIAIGFIHRVLALCVPAVEFCTIPGEEMGKPCRIASPPEGVALADGAEVLRYGGEGFGGDLGDVAAGRVAKLLRFLPEGAAIPQISDGPCLADGKVQPGHHGQNRQCDDDNTGYGPLADRFLSLVGHGHSMQLAGRYVTGAQSATEV